MKFLIAVSCIIAVATASWPVAHIHDHAGVIGPNGVPLEPAANVAARAFHHAAHVEATARNVASGSWIGDAHGWAGHGWAGHVAPLAYAGHYASGYYGGPQHLAVIGANGVPVDTPANNARRAFHHAAHVEAIARNGGAHGIGAWGYAAHATPLAWAGHGVGVVSPAGVPVDTPEVAAAKAAHFAAHAAASHGHHGHGHGW